MSAEATHDCELAESLRAAAREQAWDPGRGLFRDAPDAELYSQQTNIMARGAAPRRPAGARALIGGRRYARSPFTTWAGSSTPTSF